MMVQSKEDERDARDESQASLLLAACIKFAQESRVRPQKMINDYKNVAVHK